MQSPKDQPEAERPSNPSTPDSIDPGPIPACAMPTDIGNVFSARRRPTLLWRKSTYYWISLVSLFLATVLAIVAFSIRTSYRGGAFLDKDHLPVLFYGAAVFIGALPLSGVCALFRYEADVATGWVLFSTVVLSFLSLGPIFIFSFDSSESQVFLEDRTSATLAYVMATFCVISSMALCVAAGIAYFAITRVRSDEPSKIKDVIASVTLSIASLGAFNAPRDESKRPSKRAANTPSSVIGASALSTIYNSASPSISRKLEDSREAFSPV